MTTITQRVDAMSKWSTESMETQTSYTNQVLDVTQQNLRARIQAVSKFLVQIEKAKQNEAGGLFLLEASDLTNATASMTSDMERFVQASTISSAARQGSHHALQEFLAKDSVNKMIDSDTADPEHAHLFLMDVSALYGKLQQSAQGHDTEEVTQL